ncbi:MAG: DUF1573 domain-containing protein [Syntrophobacteraceae bacterium]
MKSAWHRISLKVAACVLVSLVSLWSVMAGASREARAQQQTAPDQSSTQNAPSIQIAEKSHNFGEVAEGSEITHVFAVKNTGKAPLQITQVRPG